MKKDMWSKYGGIFLGLILVIGLLGLLTLNDKPQFKITKIECHNETEKVYYNLVNDAHGVDCPNIFMKTSCYDSRGNIILGLECERADGRWCLELNNRTDILVLIKPQESSATLMYKSNIAESVTINRYEADILIKKGENIKEVCEQKEVDEITIIDTLYSLIGIKSEGANITYKNKTFYIFKNSTMIGQYLGVVHYNPSVSEIITEQILCKREFIDNTTTTLEVRNFNYDGIDILSKEIETGECIKLKFKAVSYENILNYQTIDKKDLTESWLYHVKTLICSIFA